MRLYLFHLICKTCYRVDTITFSENKQGKYYVQTRSQAKSSGIILPDVHGIDKGIDPKIRPER